MVFGLLTTLGGHETIHFQPNQALGVWIVAVDRLLYPAVKAGVVGVEQRKEADLVLARRHGDTRNHRWQSQLGRRHEPRDGRKERIDRD